MAGNRNHAISLCRVFSMILIILCHIIHLYPFVPGSQFLREVLNVGVYTFLAISGYLYGQKNISWFGSWVVGRAIKVLLPSSILSACVILGMALASRRFEYVSFVVYLTGLQGIAFFLPSKWTFFHQVSPIVPLWFVTVIMLCYCLIPAFQKLREKLPAYPVCLAIFAVLTVVCYGIGCATGILLFYFLTFFIGYCMGHFGENSTVTPIPFAVFTVVMAGMQVLRLVLRSIFDGSEFYQVFVGASHLTLGVWILGAFFLMGRYLPRLTRRMSENRLMEKLDGISLYVYMTHSLFISTPLSPYEYTDNLLISTVLFFLLSFVSAMLLRWISGKVSWAICK